MTYRIPAEFELDLESGLVTLRGGDPLFQIDPDGTYSQLQKRLLTTLKVILQGEEEQDSSGGVA